MRRQSKNREDFIRKCAKEPPKEWTKEELEGHIAVAKQHIEYFKSLQKSS